MIWSFVLAGIGVFGLFLAGKGDSRGWVVGIGAQVLWAIYAITTDQWGFLLSCLAYGWVYSMPLYRKWRADQNWVRDYEAGLVNIEVVASDESLATFFSELKSQARRFGDGRRNLS